MHTETEVGQGAACVNKIDGQNFARKLREGNTMVVLIGQSEIRHRLSDLQRFHFDRVRMRELVQEFQSARGTRSAKN